MNHTFFLTTESFDEANSTFAILESLVYGLHDQINQINTHEGNSLTICSDIYSHWQWQGHMLAEIWQPDCQLDRDFKFMLQRLFEKASDTDEPSTSISFGYIDNGNGATRGLLTLQKRNKYAPHLQVDSNTNSWYLYCLDKIKSSPLTSRQFIDDCRILFDNLEIIDRNYSSIASIYDKFKERILHHLNGLNLYMREAQQNSKNRNDALIRLSSLGNFDEVASTEGNASRKKDFTFQIEDKSVCCEPHIKLSKSDVVGDSEYYFHRIYFHEGVPTLKKGKIIIGHIGKHL